MQMGNDNDAIVDLTRAISLDPKNAGAHADRARLCHKHGQYESAVADFQKAHVLDPSAGYDRLAVASNHDVNGEMRESHTFHSLAIEEFEGDEEDGCDRPPVGEGFREQTDVLNTDLLTRRETPPHSRVLHEGGTNGATSVTGLDDKATYSDSLLKRVEVELVEDDTIAEATPLVSSPNADAIGGGQRGPAEG